MLDGAATLDGAAALDGNDASDEAAAPDGAAAFGGEPENPSSSLSSSMYLSFSPFSRSIHSSS